MAKLFFAHVVAWLLLAKSIHATPNYLPKFSVECPIMPVIPVLTSSLESEDPQVNSVDFYEIKIRPFRKQMFPEGLIEGYSGTELVGYNGTNPGPTFRQKQGRESVVRFINYGDCHAAIHLHGSATVAPFDGWANDTISPGQYKDYYYPNFQSGRTLWYHDHAHKETALNVGLGQAGFYILQADEGELDLPQGEYDIPLMLASKTYLNKNGELDKSTSKGDSIEVNGQLYPYLAVEPRKYRFRFLNAAASRTFYLRLVDGNKASDRVVPLNITGSDAGLLEHTVTESTGSLPISMGERYEIVVDFKDYTAKNLTLFNNDPYADTENVKLIMQFNVGQYITNSSYNSLPYKLQDVQFPNITNSVKTRDFIFDKVGNEWMINNQTYTKAGILAYPSRGTTEIWNLINQNNSFNGPIHPIHLHLVDMKVVSRLNKTSSPPVPIEVPEYEAASLKDVVFLRPGENITVVAKFTPWDGLYMFHCHNLDHEDGEMMSIFNVTALENFGYPEKTRFLNPMDPRWKPQDYSGTTDLEDIRNRVLPDFKKLEAYDNIPRLMQALDDYHKNHTHINP